MQAALRVIDASWDAEVVQLKSEGKDGDG